MTSDGGSNVYSLASTDGGFQPMLEGSAPAPVLEADNVNSAVASMDAFGFESKWDYPPYEKTDGVTSLLWDRPYGYIFGTVDAGLNAYSYTVGVPFVPTLGFVLSQVTGGAGFFAARVSGHPQWALRCANGCIVGDWSSPTSEVATLSNSDSITIEPTNRLASPPSLLVDKPDGGQVLVATVLDRIWAGDVSSVLANRDAGAVTLQLELNPFPNGRIQSVVLTPTEGSNYLNGYLLVQEHLFSFTALTPNRWDAKEITLPDGDPIALWTDGAHARVGYASGAVYSLPSRVQIGEPAFTQTPVSDYAGYGTLCGNAYALANGALYQLNANPDGGPIGTWLRVPVEPVLSRYPITDNGLEAGSLFTTDDELLLMNAFGATVRIGDSTCAH